LTPAAFCLSSDRVERPIAIGSLDLSRVIADRDDLGSTKKKEVEHRL
jgi:hypothetical protein